MFCCAETQQTPSLWWKVESAEATAADLNMLAEKAEPMQPIDPIDQH